MEDGKYNIHVLFVETMSGVFAEALKGDERAQAASVAFCKIMKHCLKGKPMDCALCGHDFSVSNLPTAIFIMVPLRLDKAAEGTVLLSGPLCSRCSNPAEISPELLVAKHLCEKFPGSHVLSIGEPGHA